MVGSVAYAEIGGMFHITQIPIPMRRTLNIMGYHQSLTPIRTDDAIVHCHTNNNMQMKKIAME